MQTKPKIPPPNGYDLSEHVLIDEPVCTNPATSFGSTAIASVRSYKFSDTPEPFVFLQLSEGAFKFSAHMHPGTARRLAAALLDAAKIVEDFEAERATTTAREEVAA